MFKISFSPVLSDDELSLEKQGDALIINGDLMDFSDLPVGGSYPAEALENPEIVGGVDRIDGEIRLTVRLPYWMLGQYETPEPIIVINDGTIALPEGRYPLPPEDLPIIEPLTEGEDNAGE